MKHRIDNTWETYYYRILKMDGKYMYVVDLFAGCGGLSLGLKWAGFKSVLGIEIDKWAAETYKENFPSVPVICSDIRKIKTADIPNLINECPTIVCGGPPCQGFSHSNIVNRDPKDPRNSLFLEFIRWVDVLRPKICLMENVRGLLRSVTENGERVIDLIEAEFNRIGYSSETRLLDAQYFGVPQKRERVFIIATSNEVDIHPSLLFPDQTHKNGNSKSIDIFGGILNPAIKLWDAISDLPQKVWREFDPNESYPIKPKNDFQKLMRDGNNGMIYNHEPMRHTDRIVERFKHISFGQSEEDLPECQGPRRRGTPTENSKKRYGQNSRRQRPDEPCNTIVASSHTNYIHPFLHRNFTVREMMRIQSFPDSFIMCGKRAVLSKKLSKRKGLDDEVYLDQRMQVGNAVPPILASAIGRKILSVINKHQGN